MLTVAQLGAGPGPYSGDENRSRSPPGVTQGVSGRGTGHPVSRVIATAVAVSRAAVVVTRWSALEPALLIQKKRGGLTAVATAMRDSLEAPPGSVSCVGVACARLMAKTCLPPARSLSKITTGTVSLEMVSATRPSSCDGSWRGKGPLSACTPASWGRSMAPVQGKGLLPAENIAWASWSRCVAPPCCTRKRS